MVQPLKYLKETASQTAGPFVHIGLCPATAGLDTKGDQPGNVIAPAEAPGQRIAIEGAIFDGAASPIKDAVIEIWQADAAGVYHHEADPRTGFRGWGRVAPRFDDGTFRIETIKPGSVALANGAQMAPHLCLWIVARGINTGLHTRLYFEDEAEANAVDPVLGLIEQDRRRATLVAQKSTSGYHFDIVLKGENETVFFDV